MEAPANDKPIGRVVGTERKPNTAFTFNFWCNPDAPVGIGTIVVGVNPGWKKDIPIGLDAVA